MSHITHWYRINTVVCKFMMHFPSLNYNCIPVMFSYLSYLQTYLPVTSVVFTSVSDTLMHTLSLCLSSLSIPRVKRLCTYVYACKLYAPTVIAFASASLYGSKRFACIHSNYMFTIVGDGSGSDSLSWFLASLWW